MKYIPETMEECLALVVLDWRKRKGFNQQKAAAYAGISQATLSRIERGEADPAFKTLLTMFQEDLGQAMDEVLALAKEHGVDLP